MRYSRLGIALVLAMAAAVMPMAVPADEKTPADRSRTFFFTYEAKVTDLPPGKVARIWIPLASSNAEQEVHLITQNFPKGTRTRTGNEKQYRNRILYVEGQANSAGEIPIQLVFRVARREVRTTGPHATLIKGAPDEDMNRYLKPDVKVPVGGKPLELVKDMQLPAEQFAAAKLLYDVVNKHMTYSKKGTGWGQGDAVWACTSGYGNCTDFHSLFISLARSEKIPAKFVMGFAIPARGGSGPIAGYHCWAWFHVEGKGWTPVDISEAKQEPEKEEYYFGNLTENRVQFSTGRDITLEPRQNGGPLNYFIYPYVEVDGRPYPADKVERHFSYRDAPAAG
jgi:transglutaminase-like putative cysteine protease